MADSSAAHWYPTAAYLYTLHLDAPALAWEYLRRHPDYRLDWLRCHRRPQAAQVAAHRWRRWPWLQGRAQGKAGPPSPPLCDHGDSPCPARPRTPARTTLPAHGHQHAQALHTGQGKTGQVAVADALRVLHALGGEIHITGLPEAGV